MSRDPLYGVATVRDFLQLRLLEAVPADLKGETRAAIKLLDECVREIDERAFVFGGIDAKLSGLLGQQTIRDSAEPDQFRLTHDDVLAAADRRLAELHSQRIETGAETSGSISDQINDICNLLGQEALVRTRWQSVFLSTTRTTPSTTARGTADTTAQE